MQSPPSRQGSVLAGRFHLDTVLGHGGMGSVYEATDISIGRRVAIKVLRRELADDPDNLERMREEAFSLALLHHPNVVQLYDFVANGPDETFMVMELVGGPSLAKRLADAQMLPLGLALDYMLDVLSALAAAHDKGIVHRDVKPANILVQPVPARRDLIKVLDFGIAKLTEATIRRNPTTAGALLGTPSYMSPEQASGRVVDARADIYAAGLVLYRMLTGTNPFEGFDLATTLVKVQGVPPPDLQQLRPDIPPHVAQAVARAVAKDPNQRFAKALDFAHALRSPGVASTGMHSQSAHSPQVASSGRAPSTIPSATGMMSSDRVSAPPHTPQPGHAPLGYAPTMPSGNPPTLVDPNTMQIHTAHMPGRISQPHSPSAPPPHMAHMPSSNPTAAGMMPMQHMASAPPPAMQHMASAPPPAMMHPGYGPPTGVTGTGPHSASNGGSGKGMVVGAVIGIGAVVILGLTATIVYLVTRTSPTAEASIVDAGTSAAPPAVSSVPSAVTSARPPPQTKGPTTKPVANDSANAQAQVAPSGPLNNCRCLPNSGNFNHGDNMGLLPKFVTPACECAFPGATLCLDQVKPCNGRPGCDDSFDALCKRHRAPGFPEQKCVGFDTNNERHEGKLECQQSVSEFVYQGPARRPCKGFTVDNKLLDGVTFCRN